MSNKLIAISGCSGGGKSTLLSELSNQGYTVFPEVGREIVKEQVAINGDITPWQNPKTFCELLIERAVKNFHQAQTLRLSKEKIIFFDRSFLEGISYYQTLKISDSCKYDHLIDDLRYYATIFMTPPWKEIFVQDAERKHSFEDGVREYARLLKFYEKHRYQMIELPKKSVEERIKFLFSSIV